MAFSLKTHVFKTREGVSKLAEVRPYVRLMGEGGPPIFVQYGKFWTESGKEVNEDDLPAWIDDALSKLNDSVKREVGL